MLLFYQKISRLRDFLLEHRKAYLSLTSYLNDGPQLSDFERDKVDAGAQRIMKTCSALIHDFRRQTMSCDVSNQVMVRQYKCVIFFFFFSCNIFFFFLLIGTPTVCSRFIGILSEKCMSNIY